MKEIGRRTFLKSVTAGLASSPVTLWRLHPEKPPSGSKALAPNTGNTNIVCPQVRRARLRPRHPSERESRGQLGGGQDRQRFRLHAAQAVIRRHTERHELRLPYQSCVPNGFPGRDAPAGGDSYGLSTALVQCATSRNAAGVSTGVPSGWWCRWWSPRC